MAAKKAPTARATKRAELDKLAREQRKVLNHAIEELHARPLVTEMRAVSKSMDALLKKVVKGKGPVTAAELARVDSMVRQHVLKNVFKMSGPFVESGGVAYRAGLEATTKYAQAVGLSTARLKDPVNMKAIEAKADRALEAARRQTMAKYSAEVAKRVRDRLQEATPADTTRADVRGLVRAAFQDEEWRLARIARTEGAVAFNTAQHVAITELARDAGKAVYMRWTEHVDDVTGMPLDKRVAKDSLVLHGQVARPGKRFTMPSDDRAPSAMVGKSWSGPPNRPNDRAVLLPWYPGLPIPAWTMRDGQRVSL